MSPAQKRAEMALQRAERMRSEAEALLDVVRGMQERIEKVSESIRATSVDLG